MVKTFAQSVESFHRLYSLIVKIKEVVLKLTMSYTNKMSWFEVVSTSTAFFLVPVALLLIKFNGNVTSVVANSVIYFLIGPTFAIFIMRTATISQYSYFAELALYWTMRILPMGIKSVMERELNSRKFPFLMIKKKCWIIYLLK